MGHVLQVMEYDKQKPWSSVELHKLYTYGNGVNLQKKSLINTVLNYYGDHLFLIYKGLARMLVFRGHVSGFVLLVEKN